MLERQVLEDAMGRALALARRGPALNMNPQVGCVLLAPDGRIVAEGWHLGSGTPHAEVDALAHLPEEWRTRAHMLTAVVTLEPCNHTGRTGPCAEALREARIGAVVYALRDPGRASAGGANVLREAGVRVMGGVLADEANELLAPWLSRQHSAGPASPLPRPHVTVKWAQTLDGRAAAADGSSQWITGPEARADVHRRRAEADAILIGTGTLYADNPSLTARKSAEELLVPGEQQPIPVVLGHRAIPEDARLREHPALSARGLHEPWHLSGDDLAADLAELYEQGVRHLLVEGGPAVASSFIAAGLADEVLIYIAPALLGGPRLAIHDLGIASMAGIKRLQAVAGAGAGFGADAGAGLIMEHLGDDLLVRGTLSTPTGKKD